MAVLVLARGAGYTCMDVYAGWTFFFFNKLMPPCLYRSAANKRCATDYYHSTGYLFLTVIYIHVHIWDPWVIIIEGVIKNTYIAIFFIYFELFYEGITILNIYQG